MGSYLWALKVKLRPIVVDVGRCNGFDCATGSQTVTYANELWFMVITHELKRVQGSSIRKFLIEFSNDTKARPKAVYSKPQNKKSKAKEVD